MSIVFVKTRHHYDPYIDFRRLAELSGFESCYVDQIDVTKDNVYIVSPMNGEYRPHIDNQINKPRNAHLVLWNLERPSGSAGSVGNYAKDNRELIDKRYVDEVWVSDARMADETRHACRFVPLGGHPDLGNPGDDKEYDVIHLSAMVNRRQTVYGRLKGLSIAPNAWPPEREELLARSRFALNVHQDSHPFQEPLRWVLFAAYGLPIISESCFDPRPWTHRETIYFANYDDLPREMAKIAKADYREWKEMGLRARRLMTEEYTFREQVELALRQSVGVWR